MLPSPLGFVVYAFLFLIFANAVRAAYKYKRFAGSIDVTKVRNARDRDAVRGSGLHTLRERANSYQQGANLYRRQNGAQHFRQEVVVKHTKVQFSSGASLVLRAMDFRRNFHDDGRTSSYPRTIMFYLAIRRNRVFNRFPGRVTLGIAEFPVDQPDCTRLPQLSRGR